MQQDQMGIFSQERNLGTESKVSVADLLSNPPE